MIIIINYENIYIRFALSATLIDDEGYNADDDEAEKYYILKNKWWKKMWKTFS